MPFAAGQSLSFYEILGSLGAGAMGEVYRARDTRLDREVAIKVLPEHFADDEERLRRFEREAKSLASLNHPNVAQIHGVDRAGDTCFLVLELVPGETLEERIARGPLPLEDAIDVGRQIAEGLEAAHQAGVIHRDLKPANVRITPAGKVKVLDFGLAKPTGPDAGPGSTTDSVLATEEGRLLGTPTYMAPEQARGKPIDRRVDVWAFGCVLYECLTGERAFAGETISDVLAAVLQDEPNWTRLPAGTPAHVRALLARCLAKDPRLRVRDVGDAWLELSRPDADPLAAPASHGTRDRGAHVAGIVAGIVAALAGGALLGFALRPEPEPERPHAAHLALPAPPELAWRREDYISTFAISPDGECIVYCATLDQGARGKVDVLVRWRRSEPEPEILWSAGVGIGVIGPFFSADGAWVGFQEWREGLYELHRVPTIGGDPELLCSLPNLLLGASQGPAGTILCGVLANGIYSVPEQGGTPTPVTEPVPDVEWTHKFPVVLPGGEELLYVIDYEGLKFDLVLRSLTTGDQEVLIPGATSAHYLAPGYLVYTKGQDVWADTFDPETHRLGGSPVQLPERVAQGIPSYLDLAQDGTLVYAAPKEATAKRPLVWVTREGREERTGFPPDCYVHVELSPSGDRTALALGFPLEGEVRVGDLARESLDHPLASERSSHPVWTPDGEQLVWYDRSGGYLVRQSASGAGQSERGGRFEATPLDVLEGDLVLHARKSRAGTGFDLFLTPFDGDPKVDAVPLLVERGDQFDGTLSRDGLWLAYATALHGDKSQVFVSSFPVDGPGTQVSFGGGWCPRWSRDGKELFFATPSGNLMTAAVTATVPEIRFGEPVFLYDGLSTTTGYGNRPFDVAPDGHRFLVIEDDPYAPVERPELRVVVHWVEELKERLEERD